jgi:hypothetical protein
VGKNVEVNGVFGKWLDVLLLVREGETLEFEARHDRGEQLTFPGELLRKVAPYKPEDYPVLPEDFRGFQGSLAAKVLKKDAATFEMIVEVERILESSGKSQAKDPKSIEGKKAMLAGFWQRKDDYHALEVGDRIETGIQHIGLRSDHLTIAETLRKTNAKSDARPKNEGDAKADEPKAEAAATGFPEGMRGFRGMFTGTLVSKDVEKGEFVVKAERIDRVWPRNKATNTKSGEGREFTVRGVSGKFLDVLVQMKPGDRLQTEAFHNRGEHLDFPGETLKKVE